MEGTRAGEPPARRREPACASRARRRARWRGGEESRRRMRCQAADRLRDIGPPGGCERHRSDDPVGLDAEDGLQHPHGPQRTRIDRKIEDGEIEPRRQLLGAHGIPIEAPVDRDGPLPRQAANVVDGDGMPPRPCQRRMGDAELGRSARVARDAARSRLHAAARDSTAFSNCDGKPVTGDPHSSACRAMKAWLPKYRLPHGACHAAEGCAGLKSQHHTRDTGRVTLVTVNAPVSEAQVAALLLKKPT